VKLRDKLFLSYSLLSIVVLLLAAWVVDSQVVAQARQQVQEELRSSLPLYDAVWDEQAGRLSTLGMAMAGSPIVKTIFGDSRASRDRETIRQMLLEFGPELTRNVDLVVIADGGGEVVFSEDRSAGTVQVRELAGVRTVAKTQKPGESFEVLDGRLYHMAFSPVVAHSGNAEFNNTLVVLATGSELNRQVAEGLKRRANSDVLFFSGRKLYSSSLDPSQEATVGRGVAAGVFGAASRGGGAGPAEMRLGGGDHLAFMRPLVSLDGRPVGHVVVLHSLERAGRLFRAISNQLILLGTVSVILVLATSYYIARRTTKPIESLVVAAKEFGEGNYEHPVGTAFGGEMAQLAAAFEQMRLSIRQGQAELLRSERLAIIGQMASSIIHDLRSPLAAISTAAQVTAKSELTREQRQVLAESQLRAAQRMEAMLREVLEYSKGSYSLRLARLELAPMIQSIANDSATPDLFCRVEMKLDVPPRIFVEADAGRMRRLFDNLLANSIQAMPDGGTITIRAAVSGPLVRINVADTGGGVPSRLRDRLFEPFVSQGKQGGTGLGLAIASSIAKAHGGSLTLVSGIDQSADFCVELPLAPEESHGGQDSAG
jgi:signal transduction histidine kinase